MLVINITKEELKALIDESISIGEHVSVVETFLDDSGLEHYPLASESEERSVPLVLDLKDCVALGNVTSMKKYEVNRVVQESADLETSEVSSGNEDRYIVARIRDASHTLFVRESLLMLFYFDDNNKLERYEVESRYTGL